MTLVNQRTGTIVATAVELALTRRTRKRGLLGRTGLPGSSALVLAPCAAIHTLFMRFAIDVAFLDEDGRVLRVIRDLRPWRMAVSPFAHAVVELAAGALGPDAVRPGDRLYLVRQQDERLAINAGELRQALGEVPCAA